MRRAFTVGSFAPIRRAAVPAVSVMLAAAAVVGCAASTSADVGHCFTASVVSFDQTQGNPRAYQNLELTVSCSPKRPFELSEVSETGDYPVLAVQGNGPNTCLHRPFKAKGEKCTVQVAFEPHNKLGEYFTYIYFQYAGENETFLARLTGNINKA